MQDPFLDTAVQMPHQTMYVQTGNYLEWPSCAGSIRGRRRDWRRCGCSHLGPLRDQEAQVWSARTLAEALAQEHGIALSPRQLRKYRKEMGASYRRTKSTLQHRQDPERVAQAKAERQALKKVPGRDPATLLPG